MLAMQDNVALPQVFVTDKRRAEELGGAEPFNRIKKDLLLEVQSLQPEDRVVLIGCTNEPHSCTKKDGEALLAAFDKHFYVPLPDYATRQACSCCAVCDASPGMTVTYGTCRWCVTVTLRNEANHMLDMQRDRPGDIAIIIVGACTLGYMQHRRLFALA